MSAAISCGGTPTSANHDPYVCRRSCNVGNGSASPAPVTAGTQTRRRAGRRLGDPADARDGARRAAGRAVLDCRGVAGADGRGRR